MSSTNIKNKKWAAEKAGLSVMASAICGKNVPIRDVEERDAVAYTGPDGIIRLAQEHELFNGLSEIEKIAARRGICAHEVLHLKKTDFNAFEKEIKRVPKYEQQIFAHINNIVEDCAIETQAEDTIGGTTLEALDFIIAHAYKQTPNIETSEYALGQFLVALGQFGDLGLLKGHFTFPEAKRIFIESSPIFKKAIEEPRGAMRVQYSKKIFSISRPLWEEIARKNKEEYEKMEKFLKELMDALGVTKSEGKGSGMDSSGSSGDRDSSKRKNARRKMSIKIITEEEKKRLLEQMKEKNKSGHSSESGSGSSGDDASGAESCGGCNGGSAIMSDNASENGSSFSGDVELLMTEEDLKKQMKNIEDAMDAFSNDEAKEEEGNEENGSNTSNASSDSEKDSKESDANNSSENSIDIKLDEKLEEVYTDHNSKSEVSASNKTYEGLTMRSDKSKACPSGETNDDSVGEIEDEEFLLDEKCSKEILREMKSALESFEKTMKASDDDTDLDLDGVSVESGFFQNASCKNIKVEAIDTERLSFGYDQLYNKMSSGIKSLTKQFERIFMNDTEEMMYKNSGRTNLKRMYGGKITSRIFEKKRYPSDKDDFVVFLLIDESGSMGGLKAQTARNTAISLAEVFGKLNIPLYVMGFTSDCGADAVHNHYIRWKNTTATRLRLMDIAARANNFDGYSIRYATEILKKKSAKHKLLIVLSDGSPACYKYHGDGIEDTKDAIRQAKKEASVIGVGVGNVPTSVFMSMYGNDFLHIENVESLYSNLAKKITKLVKEWE